jgi:lysozyme
VKKPLPEESIKAMDEMCTMSSLFLKGGLMHDLTAEWWQNLSIDRSLEIPTVQLKRGDNMAHELIKRFEGFRSEAYQDVVGVWTIGYGHTKFVREGDTCTREQADEYLNEDLFWVHKALEIGLDPEVPITYNMREALTSFIYNCGADAFLKSTLLRKLNQKDYVGAANEFLRWNKAGGRVIEGLKRRRRIEREIFLIDWEKLNVEPTDAGTPA